MNFYFFFFFISRLHWITAVVNLVISSSYLCSRPASSLNWIYSSRVHKSIFETVEREREKKENFLTGKSSGDKFLCTVTGEFKNSDHIHQCAWRNFCEHFALVLFGNGKLCCKNLKSVIFREIPFYPLLSSNYNIIWKNKLKKKKK